MLFLPFFIKLNELFCLVWFLTPLSFSLHLCWLLTLQPVSKFWPLESVHFSEFYIVGWVCRWQLICYTGGCINPDSFHLEESLPEVYLVQLDRGQTALVMLKPMSKEADTWQSCMRISQKIYFLTCFSM